MDEAGQKALEKSVAITESIDLESSVVALGDAKDPGDFLQENELEALKKFLKYPINSFDYLLNKAVKESVEKGNAKLITESLERLFHIIRGNTSKIRREVNLKKIAKAFSISERAVFSDFSAKPSEKSIPRLESKPQLQRKERGYLWTTELYFVAVLLSNPQYLGFAKRYIVPEDFQDDWAMETYQLLLRKGKDDFLDLQAFFEELGEENFKIDFLEKVNLGEFSNPLRIV